jgi:hypothetical protein
MRLLRFTAGAVLALLYGPGILRMLESETFQVILVTLVSVTILAAVLTAVVLWRRTHPPPLNGT